MLIQAHYFKCLLHLALPLAASKTVIPREQENMKNKMITSPMDKLRFFMLYGFRLEKGRCFPIANFYSE